jgi:hypothetical protein
MKASDPDWTDGRRIAHGRAERRAYFDLMMPRVRLQKEQTGRIVAPVRRKSVAPMAARRP